MNTPILKACYNCNSNVFEYEENMFGCDNCKAVWTYKDEGWWNVSKERTIKKSVLHQKKSKP